MKLASDYDSNENWKELPAQTKKDVADYLRQFPLPALAEFAVVKTITGYSITLQGSTVGYVDLEGAFSSNGELERMFPKE